MRTAQLVASIFPPEDVDNARRLLEEECADNLPLIHSPDPESLDRIRFAAIRASGGDLEQLLDMVVLAQVDWRDLLVVAGFGYSTEAHNDWANTTLEAE